MFSLISASREMIPSEEMSSSTRVCKYSLDDATTPTSTLSRRKKKITFEERLVQSADKNTIRPSGLVWSGLCWRQLRTLRREGCWSGGGHDLPYLKASSISLDGLLTPEVLLCTLTIYLQGMSVSVCVCVCVFVCLYVSICAPFCV